MRTRLRCEGMDSSTVVAVVDASVIAGEWTRRTYRRGAGCAAGLCGFDPGRLLSARDTRAWGLRVRVKMKGTYLRAAN